MRVSAIAALALMLSFPVSAAPCASPDMTSRVTGGSECLLIKTYRHDDSAAASTLFVLLHGNHSNGSPAVSQFAIAETLARTGGDGVVAVALIRPGYNDAEGNYSTGNAASRGDNFTAANNDIVAAAIGRLKAFHQARRLVLIGHSGGAAMVGAILGRHPGLADAGMLIGCPCDVPAWRAMRGRRDRWDSESAVDYVDRLPAQTRLSIVVGAWDDVTLLSLSQAYAQALAARGIAHELIVVAESDHVQVIRSPQVIAAALRLIAAE
jgi:pimeloyl-ACP methyl ester carboxylesterase